MKRSLHTVRTLLLTLLAVVFLFSAASCSFLSPFLSDPETPPSYTGSIDPAQIPAYSGSPYIVINGNVPTFSEEERTTTSYEFYTELDRLGRCGTCIASIGRDLMPTEDRGSIGQVRPTGWHTVKYEFVDGKYLYNRCHLIGFQLSGENANVKNLITGTRYLNVQGMLPFENMVADYVKETGNHVAYRVTPVFFGNNLVASGVQIEAWSVEDNGEGICFNVYCYNVQPGVEINYADGTSHETGNAPSTSDGTATLYVLNTSSGRFHLPSCSSVSTIKPENKTELTTTRETLLFNGYVPCGNCDP